LSENCLSDKTINDHINELSDKLGITPNQCKTLYDAIPDEELVNRKMDITEYLKTIADSTSKCNECSTNLVNIQTNTNRQWKGTQLCDVCWGKYENIRELLWIDVNNYKQVKCAICNIEQLHNTQRFHYDHLNMFDKGDSICSMVNNGTPFEEICQEIEKCQVLCIQCHHIVTDIERKMNFTRIKQNMTRKLNTEEITPEEYDQETMRYQAIYETKMLEIYGALRKIYD
jgi:hypothetical protein